MVSARTGERRNVMIAKSSSPNFAHQNKGGRGQFYLLRGNNPKAERKERSSKLRGPQYRLMVGTQAIQVPLKATVLPPLGHSSRRHPTISSSSSSSVQAITPVPTAQVLNELRAVVQVHINSERRGAGVESVLAWFEDRGQGFSIELIDVIHCLYSLQFRGVFGFSSNPAKSRSLARSNC